MTSLAAGTEAGRMTELAGDAETALEIYYDTYDIHELPAPEKGGK